MLVLGDRLRARVLRRRGGRSRSSSSSSVGDGLSEKMIVSSMEGDGAGPVKRGDSGGEGRGEGE